MMKTSKFKLSLIAVVFCGFAFSQGDPSKFRKGIDSLRSGKLGDAEAQFAELAQSYPLNGLYWFNLGQVFLVRGKLAKSVSAFRTVISLKSPLSPAARLYLSRAYRGMGRNRRAEGELQRVRKQGLPENLRREAELDWVELKNPDVARAIQLYRRQKLEQAIAELEGKTDPAARLVRGLSLAGMARFKEAKIELAAVRDTPSDIEILSERAKEVEEKIEDLPSNLRMQGSFSTGFHSNIFGDGKSEVKRSRFGLTVGLLSEMRFISNSFTQISGSYQIYLEEYPGLGTARFMRQVAKAHFVYPRYKLRLSPLIEWQVLASENFIFQGGIEAEYRSSLVDITFDLRKNSPAHSVYEYMDGIQLGAKVSKSWSGFRAAYLFRWVSISDLPVGSDTLPLRHLGHGPQLEYSADIGKYNVGASLAYVIEHYTRRSLLGLKERRDKQLSFQAVVQRALRDNLYARLRIGWVSNDSTFESGDPDDRDFSQFWIRAGVLWDIL